MPSKKSCGATLTYGDVTLDCNVAHDPGDDHRHLHHAECEGVGWVTWTSQNSDHGRGGERPSQ